MGTAKSVTLGHMTFDKKGDAVAFIRSILNRYKPGDRVTDEDGEVLTHLLQRHPEADEKIGAGISYFNVRSADYGTQCFWVTRADGTTERFSYKSCI